MFNIDHLEQWVSQIKKSDRVALSKAITLIESQKKEDKSLASNLIRRLASDQNHSIRIGITGPPGAGKSSLIEVLGLLAVQKGYQVAVLSIDPSSAVTKGSILGDKTRMVRLSAEKNAFIRPSPSGEQLGGVAKHTRESIWLLEAAGFDFILVETAGIGQSEYLVSTMTDLTILLNIPGAGDELQGIKKGIFEWADILVLNKADGDLNASFNNSYHDLLVATQLSPAKTTGWERKIIKTSALLNIGIDQLLKEIEHFRTFIQDRLSILRQNQKVDYFHQILKERLWEKVEQNNQISEFLIQTEKNILQLEISPEEATDISIDFIFALLSK